MSTVYNGCDVISPADHRSTRLSAQFRFCFTSVIISAKEYKPMRQRLGSTLRTYALKPDLAALPNLPEPLTLSQQARPHPSVTVAAQILDAKTQPSTLNPQPSTLNPQPFTQALSYPSDDIRDIDDDRESGHESQSTCDVISGLASSRGGVRKGGMARDGWEDEELERMPEHDDESEARDWPVPHVHILCSGVRVRGM